MRYKQTQQFNLMYNVSCETGLQMLEFNYSMVFYPLEIIFCHSSPRNFPIS